MVKSSDADRLIDALIAHAEALERSTESHNKLADSLEKFVSRYEKAAEVIYDAALMTPLPSET